MKPCTVLPLLLLASRLAIADEASLPRAEVKRETLEAICRGDELAPGDSAMTLRELFPEDYKGREARCRLSDEKMAAMHAAARKRQDSQAAKTAPTK